MSLSAGTCLGPFEVISPIGGGGMGVVYRARDTNLNRDVAIKVLPELFALDADRLVRFKREAQVLASLNHPNIAAIYGIEGNALVMELVEGEDLSTLIASTSGIPITDVLAIARQIAEALEAAHEQGIVHRDFKPQNIKVRADGTVKVLDFGLAKAMDPAVGSDAGMMNSPTLTARATQIGMIVGTAAYMSPEQARGKAVDKRADVWAFGAVLYEMLAGRRAFQGDDITDTLTAVTRDTPDWTALPPETPPPLRRLVERCLERDIKMRLRDVGEARIALSGGPSGAAATPSSATMPPSAPVRRSIVPMLAAGVAIAALSGSAAWFAAKRSDTAAAPALTSDPVQVTTDSGVTLEPAVSPTGSLLAYASDRGGAGLDIWVQPLPSGDPVRITRDEADDREPNFSPDGSRIVFRSERDGGGIYVVPSLGGAERLLVARGRVPVFSRDGKRIAYRTGGRGGDDFLWVVDAAGGEPKQLATAIRVTGRPVWMDDGVTLVILGFRRDGTRADWDWYSVDATTGAATPMGAAGAFKSAGLDVPGPEALMKGRIVFSTSGGSSASLWTLALSSDRRSVAGAPQRLTASTRTESWPSVVTTPAGATLYYASLDLRANVYRLPVATNDTGATGEPAALTDAATTIHWPSISSDGHTLGFMSPGSITENAWVRNLTTGQETQAASADRVNTMVLNPDGTTMAMATDKGLALQPVGGGTPRVLKDAHAQEVWDWPTPSLLTAGSGKLLAIDPRAGTSRKILEDGPGMYYGHGRLSPDGKWMSAMEWLSADRARVIVFPFRDAPVPQSEWIAVTDGQTVAEEHAWSPDGSLLYIVSEKDGYRCIWAQRLDPKTKHPIGPLTSVAHFHRARLQMIATARSPQRIVLSPQGLIFSMDERRGNIWTATIR